MPHCARQIVAYLGHLVSARICVVADAGFTTHARDHAVGVPPEPAVAMVDQP